jgi:hypothetical protein
MIAGIIQETFSYRLVSPPTENYNFACLGGIFEPILLNNNRMKKVIIHSSALALISALASETNAYLNNWRPLFFNYADY